MRPGNHITLEESSVAHSLTVYHIVTVISEVEKSIRRILHLTELQIDYNSPP